MRQLLHIIFICLLFMITAQPSQALFGARSLDGVVKKLAKDLVKQGDLKGVIVMISPHDLYEATTRLSLPFANLLREKMITEMKNAGARVLVDGADGEFFMIMQGTWMDQGDDLAINLKVMRLTKDGPEVKASASGKVAKKKIDPKLLTPDRDSWARYLVRSLEQKTDNWLSRTVYISPFKGKDCSEELGPYLSGWLRPALAESSIMVPLDQTRQLFDVPVSTLRTRGTRGISKIKKNTPNQPSFTADLLNADCELKSEYFLHGESIELRTRLTDREGRQLAAASAELPKAIFPASLLKPRPAPKFAPNSIANNGSASLVLNGLKVELTTTKGEARPYYKQGEEIRFMLRLNRPAWVYLFDLNPAGDVILLYPVDDQGQLARNAGYLNSPEHPLILPEDGYSYELIADKPFGTDRVFAVAAETPLNFPADLNGQWGKVDYLSEQLRLQGMRRKDGYSEAQVEMVTGK